MFTFVLVCHVLIAIVLVIIVLVQSGKGGGLGAGFGGGGANTLFGSSGGGNFFTKLTMCLAAAFMVTSLTLTWMKSKSLKTSIFDQQAPGASAPAAPAQPGDAPAPAAPAEPAADTKGAAESAPAVPEAPAKP